MTINHSATSLQYPIGPYVAPSVINHSELENAINTIQTFPKDLQETVAALSREQLETSYREGGWTVTQLIHHCADSHINSYTRFKLALTEDKPVIKPYYEERWAELPDAKECPIEVSLHLLMALHFRWTVLLKSLTVVLLERSFVHPAQGNEVKLWQAIDHYSWHCRHHLAHITELKKRKGW